MTTRTEIWGTPLVSQFDLQDHNGVAITDNSVSQVVVTWTPVPWITPWTEATP
jgi:hypothetical protein